MCLAIPGKIVSIDSSNPELKMAKVNFGGIIKEACVQFLDDVSVGEYVIVHAGYALNKVNAEEAEETVRFLNELNNLLDE